MKRLMPSSLIAFLAANPNCIKSDLFVITLPNSQTIYTCEQQWDITIPSGTNGWTLGTKTFSATQYGRWNRGAITSEASFNLSSNSMTLTCVPQQATVYPGTTAGILGAANAGLFDAATVGVYTCYMPSGGYGNVSAGIETKFFGFIEKVSKLNRVSVEFEVQDALYLLNEKIPKRIIQSACPWSFGDSNCAVSGGVAAYTQAFTAKSGSTQSLLTPVSAFVQAAGYFSQGVVKCVTGANAGWFQTVKTHAGGNLQTVLPFFFPVTAGDTFSVVAGCDKSTATCASKFNNMVHYGGMPNVPQPLEAL